MNGEPNFQTRRVGNPADADFFEATTAGDSELATRLATNIEEGGSGAGIIVEIKGDVVRCERRYNAPEGELARLAVQTRERVVGTGGHIVFYKNDESSPEAFSPSETPPRPE